MDASSTMLSYGFSTDPNPIQISTTQITTQARLNISAGASQAVYCNQIVVAIPVGPDQSSLFALPPAGSVSTNKWSVTSQVKRGSDLWFGDAEDNQDYATFTYDCASSTDFLINYNLVFGVFGAVNSVVGDVSVAIQEMSGTTNDPSTFTAKAGFFPLKKDLPQFHLDNFVATAPGTPTVPTTDFANGAAITFEWESNGTYFQLFMKDQSTPVYAGTATTFTLSTGVPRDTTFILVASVTGAPGQDTPQGGYEPIYLYDSLTLTVSNPVLSPTSVAVADALTVSGASTLTTTTTGALTSASANVGGAVQAGSLATGGNLSVSGSSTLSGATVNGALSVTGGSTLNSATVNGSLNATGSASLSNVTVNGGLNARSAPVSMLGTGTLLAQGTSIAQAGIYAATDGFAVAQVVGPGNNGKSSFAYGYINTINTWFQVLGGTVGSFGSGWSDVMNNNVNAICIPIPANTNWWYSAANAGGNQMDAPIYIYWFPMGGASSSEETYRMLTESEMTELAPPAPPTVDTNQLIERRVATADSFIAQLEHAFDKSLDGEAKAQLSESLRRL